MSRYPGDTRQRALELRLRSLSRELAALQNSVDGGLNNRGTVQVTSIVTDGMAEHLAATDPHPQYTTDSEVLALVADRITQPLAALQAEVISAALTVPSNYQYLVWGQLQVDADMTVDGKVVIL